MKILVLGSTGYVGQHLIESLIHDGLSAAVAGASRSSTREAFPEILREFDLDFSFNEKDLASQLQAAVEWGPDVVVNCAACASLGVCEKDPDLAVKTNRPLDLLNALAKQRMSSKRAGPLAGTLLVHLSTDIVFGGTKSGTYTEDDPASPVNAYGRSKAAMDSILQLSASAAGSESAPDGDGKVGSDRVPVVAPAGIRSIILRPTNIIGEPAPRIDRPKFLQWLANRIKDRDLEPAVGASSSSGDGAATLEGKCSQEQTKCFDDGEATVKQTFVAIARASVEFSCPSSLLCQMHGLCCAAQPRCPLHAITLHLNATVLNACAQSSHTRRVQVLCLRWGCGGSD